MFEVIVNTKSGKKVDHVVCEQPQCLLGKDKECLITLHGWKVSGVHARVSMREDGVFVEDANSRAGTYVNGKKISGKESVYGPLTVADKVAIGDYLITIKGQAPLVTSTVTDTSSNKVVSIDSDNTPPTDSVKKTVKDEKEAGEINESLQNLYENYRSRVHRGLLELIDLRRINVGNMDDEELRSFTRQAITEVVQTIADVPEEIDIEELQNQVLAESVGLGPLEKLLEQEEISEIMVNSHKDIFYERQGRLQKSAVTFTDDQAVLSAIERIVAPLGRRIDESSPMVDARLKDGSRVNAIIPPLALKGPSITIRKFMKERLGASKLVDFGSLNQVMVDFLDTCVTHKKNVVISGGTGSGKTTLLNILSNFIPETERVVTVEDAAELKLYQPNLVSLEARPPNQEGRGAVTIRDLVKNCLRMRPDRIVVGECRGGEALDMLQAMNTGHDGSLTTVHANSPRDCISRLEVLVLMSGMDLPVNAIREQIASSIDIIVQQTRFPCGSRKITSICEVSGVESNIVQLSEIYKFEQQGFDDVGKIKGIFKPTGMVPDFYEEMKNRRIEVDFSIFSTGEELSA